MVAEKKTAQSSQVWAVLKVAAETYLTSTVAILHSLPEEQTVEIRRGVHSGKRAEYDTLSEYLW